ncbi:MULTISPECIES: hypothetical protein [unclassified Synechococcus]|uniref:hypothetical protein n=1 Tax=unclassified Synechococcus TaxID=2626047 RepID=UPI00006995A4|nr:MULTISPECIES: hypothetical protein [unclassified Synechococcus]EAQ74359.1 hypothetical protein WH5701_07016 [Synechococcus sp. WH 5701]WFN60138.1 hypothetical protein N4320_06110 [Synechococcus sp. CCFWC 502]
MGNPLDTLNAAAEADALPLELLQPLDSNNPSSTPVRLSGPEQRLRVTLDPGVGDVSLLPPSQLLIAKDGATRSIWPVHLAGWQALGWQLLSSTIGGDDAAPVNAGDNAPEPAVDSSQETPEQEPAPAPDEPTPTGEPLESTETTTSAGEALLASQPTDFQAMTKAQIVEFCSTVYGVELDGSQTKAELVEQAIALEAQASASGTASGSNEGINDAADLAALELGDALL